MMRPREPRSERRKDHKGPVIPEVRSDTEGPDDRVASSPPGFVDVESMDTTIGAASGGYLRDDEPDPDAIDQARLRLRDAQIALISLGYDITQGRAGGGGDGIDGVWGPLMRDAIAEFQGEHDLPRSGQLDASTYEAILSVYETAMETESGDPEMYDEDESDPIRPNHALKLDR